MRPFLPQFPFHSAEVTKIRMNRTLTPPAADRQRKEAPVIKPCPVEHLHSWTHRKLSFFKKLSLKKKKNENEQIKLFNLCLAGKVQYIAQWSLQVNRSGHTWASPGRSAPCHPGLPVSGTHGRSGTGAWTVCWEFVFGFNQVLLRISYLGYYNLI